ncbi:hypothetical protein GGI05_005699, partial [Coemansia sp. RSA 2603]
RQGAKQFDAVRMQYANIVDLLYAFPSCRVTAARLLDLLPPLVPRAYSVCNAGGDVWRVAFNVADYEVPAGEHVVRRRGVCTPWLEQIKPGDAVLVARRSGHFHLPANETRPVVMVGPGTGVAPFVGFLEQRAQEMQQGVVLSPAWLFFGCRSFQDRLFADQLADHLAQGTLSRLSLCFSRDAAARSLHDADVYVQDSLRRHAQELGRMLVEQRALVYVCGDARGMGPQVHEALADVLCAYVDEHPEALGLLAVEGCERLDRKGALLVLARWAEEKRYLRDLAQRTSHKPAGAGTPLDSLYLSGDGAPLDATMLSSLLGHSGHLEDSAELSQITDPTVLLGLHSLDDFERQAAGCLADTQGADSMVFGGAFGAPTFDEAELSAALEQIDWAGFLPAVENDAPTPTTTPVVGQWNEEEEEQEDEDEEAAMELEELSMFSVFLSNMKAFEAFLAGLSLNQLRQCAATINAVLVRRESAMDALGVAPAASSVQQSAEPKNTARAKRQSRMLQEQP